MSRLACRRATAGDIPAMSRIRLAVRENALSDPAREGLGAGAQLLKLAVDWLFEIGHDELRLGTRANTRADRFYAAQGWTREGMRDDIEVGYRLRRSDR